MAQKGKTFRVFVSSTFSDMKVERDMLEENVFPGLRELCKNHGCKFQVVDLRWGISDAAAVEQRTMNICLQEIERSQRISPRPNFIILIGNRYGWCPLPDEIPDNEFDLIRDHIDDADEKSLLKSWYREDRNAVPSVYCLKPREGKFRDYDVWNAEVEIPLHKALAKSARFLLPDNEPGLIKYSASATHQEIDRGLFQAEKAEEHSFCYMREIEDLSECEEDRDFLDLDESFEIDRDRRAGLQELKDRIRGILPEERIFFCKIKKNQQKTGDHLKILCLRVYESLKKTIMDEISKETETPDWEKEKEIHAEFGREYSKHFSGRDEQQKSISEYISNNENRPLIIFGKSGCGKTAFMAKCADDARKQKQGINVVSRYTGITPSSSEIFQLLGSLWFEIGYTYNDKRMPPPDYNSRIERFESFLKIAEKNKKLVLFIDGLDILKSIAGHSTLDWIPMTLPDNVKMILSIVDDENEDDSPIKRLREKTTESQYVWIDSLTESQGSQILNEMLKSSGRTLQPKHWDTVMEKFAGCPSPLFLKLVFNECSRWKSYDTVPDLKDDIPGIINTLLENLEKETDYGKIFVSFILSLIATARGGLTEDELLDLLIEERILEDYRLRFPKSPPVDRLPIIIWSRFFFDMEPYMMEISSDGLFLLSFYHRQFLDAVKSRYLSNTDDQKTIHRKLADYFRIQADPAIDLTWSGDYKRGFSELVYHTRGFAPDPAGDDEEIYKLADDQHFLERQFVVLGKIEGFLETIYIAVDLAASSEDPVTTFHFAFRRDTLYRDIIKSFTSRLHLISRENPDLAYSIAGLITDPSDRILAFTSIAWEFSDNNDLLSSCNKVLSDILKETQVWYKVFHIPVLLGIIDDMVSKGVNKAGELIKKVPDCPFRRIYSEAWKNGSRIHQCLSGLLDEPVDEVVSQEHWEEFGKLERFMRHHFSSDIPQVPFEQIEQNAFLDFGKTGPAFVLTILASKLLAAQKKSEARISIYRSLFETYSLPSPPMKIQTALMEALEKHGEKYLSDEYRDRIEHYNKVMNILVRNKRTKTPSSIAGDASSSGKAESLEQLISPRTEEDNERDKPGEAIVDIEELLKEIIDLMDKGLPAEVPGILNKIMNEVKNEQPIDDHKNAPLYIALYSISHIIDDKDTRRYCIKRLKKRNIDPELLFLKGKQAEANCRWIDSIFKILFDSCSVSILQTVAISLRTDGNRKNLYMMMKHGIVRGKDFDLIDAVSCQLLLLPETGTEELRKVSDEVMKNDRNIGMHSGLGFYYYDGLWLFFILTGIFFVALGSSSRDFLMFVPGILGSLALGALLDLLIWKKIGLWKKPEISRNFFMSHIGSYLCFLAFSIYVRIHHYPFLQAHSKDISLGAIFVVIVLFILLLTLYRSVFLSPSINLKTQIILFIITASASLAAFHISPWLMGKAGTDPIFGILQTGLLCLGLGINILLKHIPIRRFYDEKGSGIGRFEPDFDFDSILKKFPIELEKIDSRLGKLFEQVDSALERKDSYKVLHILDKIINDPEFPSIPMKSQATCFMNRGFYLRQAGLFDQALEDFNKALGLNPKSYKIYLNRGILLGQNMRSYNMALQDFTKSLELFPYQPDSFYTRGICKASMNDISGGIKDYKTALEMDPTNPNALTNLANQKFDLLISGRSQGKDDLNEVIELYRKALEEEPGDPELRCNYATVLLTSGAREEAFGILKKDLNAIFLCQERFPHIWRNQF